ncbi:hypothetical protein D910_04377 [Dendroctonus ponderosae]|uniref:Uncharacterized protein n=1 Tax=Dendroctonus ponderosae TaxID=77166 RepID=U4TZD4_DENPD|nr:hypothetical protein D910_04377 [Dendroctonus ponderosae]
MVSLARAWDRSDRWSQLEKGPLDQSQTSQQNNLPCAWWLLQFGPDLATGKRQSGADIQIKVAGLDLMSKAIQFFNGNTLPTLQLRKHLQTSTTGQQQFNRSHVHVATIKHPELL